MKKQSEPLATLMAFTTLAVIGKSVQHCMKKYAGMGRHRRIFRIRFRR